MRSSVLSAMPVVVPTTELPHLLALVRSQNFFEGQFEPGPLDAPLGFEISNRLDERENGSFIWSIRHHQGMQLIAGGAGLTV